ncbi:hypothetical protein [Amaricoccus sp.]|uniref:hypothetical protein n=1 Tax=Amaricoccus sp. TaxID=1872485 RepID=UPI00261D03C6|nr:hypothetical protein [Amaricoccus sp.]HRO11492.1 hypothetical protein [Amaricoccus sp.]
MRLAFLLVAATLAAACARQEPAAVRTASYAPQPVPCDDGGDGGVLIDGVCL